MDFSYLAPRSVNDLCNDVLMTSVAEYRHALHVLSGTSVAYGEELRLQLARLVETYERELARRTVHA